jgi:hypothetical protein
MEVCRRLRAGLPVYFIQRGGAPARSTPADCVGTTAVGVARAKAAKAGYLHRGLSGPRNHGGLLDDNWILFKKADDQFLNAQNKRGTLAISPA